MPIVNYSSRVCLFLDILGFSQRIKDGDEPSIIANAIDSIRANFAPDTEISGKQVTQFSDSIVVSYPIEEQSGVFWLLLDIGYCLTTLVSQGFPMRGAVTYGHLVHTDGYLFGEAMIHAYKMESEVAHYPRVLVHEDLLQIAMHALSEHHDPLTERSYVGGLLRRDFDGLLYINYISWSCVVQKLGMEPTDYPEYLLKISNLLRKYMDSSDLSIKAKYGWIARHYMEAKQMLDNLPSDHPFRGENPEILGYVSQLPSYPIPDEI